MDPKTDVMSLKKFIEENQALLSALAFFAAIGALLNNLPIKWVSIIFSFINILTIIIIWHELKAQLPKKSEWKLFLFRYVLICGFITLIFYWILEFREIWRAALFLPLTIIFSYKILMATKWCAVNLVKVSFMRKWIDANKWNKWLITILITFIAISAIIISLAFSIAISAPLNSVLDTIKNNIP